MKTCLIICSLIIAQLVLSGCPIKSSSSQNNDDKTTMTPKTTKPSGGGWSLTYGMTGGIAGFNDRIEVGPNGEASYFKGRELVGKYNLSSTTLDDLKWIAGRDDLVEAAGDYKSGGKIMDDITYTLNITRDGKTYSINWAYRSTHPKVLDEIREVLNKALEEVRKVANN
jgi:hypothetical protein